MPCDRACCVLADRGADQAQPACIGLATAWCIDAQNLITVASLLVHRKPQSIDEIFDLIPINIWLMYVVHRRGGDERITCSPRRPLRSPLVW